MSLRSRSIYMLLCCSLSTSMQILHSASLSCIAKGGAEHQINCKWGFINQQGKLVIKPQFDDAHSFSFGYAYVLKAKEYSLIDETGKSLPKSSSKTSPATASMADNDYGLTPIKSNGKWTIIDASGKKSSAKIDFSRSESGLVPAKEGSKYGFINKNWEFAISPVYDHAWCFSCGLAQVKVGRRIGFIDSTGKFKIQPIFLDGRSFHGELAPVKQGGLAAVKVEIKAGDSEPPI